VLAQSSSMISYPIKISEAHSVNHANYSSCLNTVVEKIKKSRGKLSGVPQNHNRASYSLWRDARDYQIDWSVDSERIARFVDAVGTPYDGAQTYLDSRLVRVTHAVSVGNVKIENLSCGKIIWMSNEPSAEERRPTIVCGSGLLQINEANYVDSGDSIFPLKSVRLRFEREC